MIYKCSNCDSALESDPDVDPLDETNYKTVEVKIYTCTSCGAELVVNAIREQFSKRLFIPRAVKKFKVD